jgi:hypothetical protein
VCVILARSVRRLGMRKLPVGPALLRRPRLRPFGVESDSRAACNNRQFLSVVQDAIPQWLLSQAGSSDLRMLGRFAWPPWRRENGCAAVRDDDSALVHVSSYLRMAPGTTDRNCRLLHAARESDSLAPVVPPDGRAVVAPSHGWRGWLGRELAR